MKNNREGKQQTSQEELSRLIFDNDLSNREEASVLLFLAYTYRSITDYLSCIDYYDFIGRLIYSTKNSKKQVLIDKTNLAEGVYVVKAKSGNTIVTKKVLK